MQGRAGMHDTITWSAVMTRSASPPDVTDGSSDTQMGSASRNVCARVRARRGIEKRL